MSKTHIDALVSIARAWTPVDASSSTPQAESEVLSEALTHPDDVGAMLWRANHDCFNYYGAPRALMLAEAPDDLAAIEASGEVYEAEGLDHYQFEQVPGDPHPAAAAKIIAAYLYQVADEPWFEGLFPRELAFMNALNAALSRRFDTRRAEESPEYTRTPWILGTGDCDVFDRE